MVRRGIGAPVKDSVIDEARRKMQAIMGGHWCEIRLREHFDPCSCKCARCTIHLDADRKPDMLDGPYS